MENSRKRRKSVGFSELDFEGRLSRSSVPENGTSQTVSKSGIDQGMEDGLSLIAPMDPISLEYRRQRRMRVRETMESRSGPWDTERDKLDASANKRIASEDTRRRILRSKRENLTRTEIEVIEECKRQDEKRAKSEKRWEEELKENSGRIKKVTRTMRRNSIKKTRNQERIAYEVVKDNIKTQARDAEVEVDRELLFKKEIDYEIKTLWQLEATRWELELEIPSLLRKVELSTDEQAYLKTSIANSYVHKRWCMGGPIDKQPWYYRPVDRKKVCEDCRADEEWEKVVKGRLEMP
ncbi:hypothetical protein BOTCAL_0087g00240 [Botryotinia calthae]|uniref:Uncharacterized protein n=1 Tax=Botryotinia calthae TaxID=38488 RepID=A0A4Y8D7C1_9HELO|nr:hypothetical protein BOTCAL_0087g00240 [Botryotinia calthae]